MKRALGFLEVQGYSVALAAANQACKSTDVSIEGIDCNNPPQGDKAGIPVLVQVKFSGEVSGIQVALEVARQEAQKFIPDEEIVTHIISSSMPGIEKLLPLGKVKRK